MLTARAGYDMEDAMILNKSSVERGAFHATMYKNETIDLTDTKGARFRPSRRRDGGRAPGEVREDGKQGGATQQQPARVWLSHGVSAARPSPHLHRPLLPSQKKPAPNHAFGQEYPRNVPSKGDSEACQSRGVIPEGAHDNADIIDSDGLPHVGAVVWPKEQYASTFDPSRQQFRSHALKGEEVAVVDHVTVVGPAVPEKRGAGSGINKATVSFRINRNPVIGDKFASRAGQKVCG